MFGRVARGIVTTTLAFGTGGAIIGGGVGGIKGSLAGIDHVEKMLDHKRLPFPMRFTAVVGGAAFGTGAGMILGAAGGSIGGALIPVSAPFYLTGLTASKVYQSIYKKNF